MLLAISNLINLYKRLVDIYRGHERSHDVVCAQYEQDELLLGQLFALCSAESFMRLMDYFGILRFSVACQLH